MMKIKKKKSINKHRLLLILSICFLLAHTACGWAGEEDGVSPALKKGLSGAEINSDDEASKKILDKIRTAIEKAKKEGKTQVDIYLDETPGLVEINDLVEVSFTATLEGGMVLSGPRGEKRQARHIIAGGHDKIPGLTDSILGMSNGQKKRIIVEPEKAFGAAKKENRKTFSAVRKIPLEIAIEKTVFEKKFKNTPSAGQKVVLYPFFHSEVINVDENKIYLRNLAKDGFKDHGPFGVTTVRIKDNSITLSVAAEIGAEFISGRKKGLIISSDEKSFTVDFNHPLAGKELALDIEILSIRKASFFKDKDIFWIEDHDIGFNIAKKKNKNVVLVLYAEWCQWCEKLFENTMTDPRIKLQREDFIWIKANSETNPELKDIYEQDGFPLIVIADSNGKILQRLDGYKDAVTLEIELDKVKTKQMADIADGDGHGFFSKIN